MEDWQKASVPCYNFERSNVGYGQLNLSTGTSFKLVEAIPSVGLDWYFSSPLGHIRTNFKR